MDDDSEASSSSRRYSVGNINSSSSSPIRPPRRGLQGAARRFQLQVQHQWNHKSPWSHSHLDFSVTDAEHAEQTNETREAEQQQLYDISTNTGAIMSTMAADEPNNNNYDDNDVNSETVLPSNTNINIDQAMQSLYDYQYSNANAGAGAGAGADADRVDGEDSQRQQQQQGAEVWYNMSSSSFLAQTEPDWLLDGWIDNNEDEDDDDDGWLDSHNSQDGDPETAQESSARLLSELYSHDGETNQEWLENLGATVARLWQEQDSQEQHCSIRSSSSNNSNMNDNGGDGVEREHDDDDDDDDFGDFQSACVEEPPATADDVKAALKGAEGIGDGVVDEAQIEAPQHHAKTATATANTLATTSPRIPRIDKDENDDGDDQTLEDATPDLIQRADDLLISRCRKEDMGVQSPDLPPTPLLVRQSEELLLQATSGVETASVAEPAATDEREDRASPLPDICSSHDVLVAWSPVRPVSLNQRHVRQQQYQQQRTPLQHECQREEVFVPISLQLPVVDLGTIEGRFTRRRQQHYRIEQERKQAQFQINHGDTGHVHDNYDMTSISDIDSNNNSTRAQHEQEEFQLAAAKQLEVLPAYYFNKPHLDDTGRVLESLPWHYVLQQREHQQQPHTSLSTTPELAVVMCEDYETSDWALWDNHMTDQLCLLDSALETVKRQLLRQVQPHENQLQTANELIHDWEQSLRLASMYWERAQESVQKAVGLEADATGVMGSSVLVQTWQQREEYQDLSRTLEQVADVLAKEQQVLDRIDSFDACQDNALEEYYALMELTKQLQATVCGDGVLSQLSCLDDMRSRLGTMRKRFWHRLHALSESMAVRCCRGLSCDWAEYESLVRSVLDLHSKGLDEESSDDVDLGMSWSDNIVKALCYEADRAFAISLLDPTDPDDSTFEKELMHLAREVDLDWGDGAKLRTLTHNLVTIRFDFESQSNYLPRVFRRLCPVLSDVLHAHFLFVQWHAAPFDDQSRCAKGLHEVRGQKSLQLNGALRAIHSGLNLSRTRLWSHCEHVITKCFEEHINFATKRNLFDYKATGTDDSVWGQDLDGLHQVLLMTDRFVSLKSSFFEEKTVEINLASGRSDGAEWPLYDKLADVFRKHLRSVHVEAMNNMGRLLSNETWRLTSLVAPADLERRSQPKPTAEALLVAALNAASSYRGGKSKKTTWGNVANENGNDPPGYFNRFVLDGNPFENTDIESLDFSSFQTVRGSDTENSSAHDSGVYQSLKAMLSESEGSRARIAPESVTRGLIAWVSRLLTVMERLPLIVEDVSAVFANLCDLYFATVLRLCVGSARDEQILLGVNQPSPFVMSHDDVSTTGPSSSSSPLFGFSRKGNGSAKGRPPRHQVALQTSLEADICAPLSRDQPSVYQLMQFIQRAQRSLQDIVNLDRVGQWLPDPIKRTSETLEEHACALARTLEQREAALSSCLVVAALFDVACSIARINLSNSFKGQFVGDLATLQSFVQAALETSPTLVAVASQMACVRAVAGLDVVTDILKVGAGWEECKLNEHPNDYIDDLCDRCALLWGFIAASGKLPPSVLKDTWGRILTGVYLSLLEGFGKLCVWLAFQQEWSMLNGILLFYYF
jgi:hypothetical protein